MGSLLNNPWFLYIVALVVFFILFLVTYRAGYTKAKLEAENDLDCYRREVKLLGQQKDFLQAEIDLLRRAHPSPEKPRHLFSSGMLSPEKEQRKTAAIRGLLDSAAMGPKGVTIIDKRHQTCGDPECPHCKPMSWL